MDTIISFIKAVLAGAFILVLLTYTVISGVWQDVNEVSLLDGQVEVTDLSYKLEDFANDKNGQIVVRADIHNFSDLDITDFDVKVAVYDCPSPNSQLTNCRYVSESEGHGWDDIPAQSTKGTVRTFQLIGMREVQNYAAFDIQFINFEGSQPHE